MKRRMVAILLSAGLILQGAMPLVGADVIDEENQVDFFMEEGTADELFAEDDPGSESFFDPEEEELLITDGEDLISSEGVEGFIEDPAYPGDINEMPEELPEEAPEAISEANSLTEPAADDPMADDSMEDDTFEEDPDMDEASAEDAQIQGAGSGSCGSGLNWTFGDDGTLTISGSGPMYEYDYDPDVDFEEDPGEADAFPWKQYRSSIRKVVVGDGVTSISAAAFWNCEDLEEVYIGKNVADIGEQAFFFDLNLETARFGAWTDKDDEAAQAEQALLPELTIGDYAFDNCECLQEIKLPKKTVSIGDGAFDLCLELAVTDVGESLETIGESAFSGCESLQLMILPATLESIGDLAFETCTAGDEYFAIRFTGDFPQVGDDIFSEDLVEVYYPMRNETYTKAMVEDETYGGAEHVKWIPYGTEIKLKEDEFEGYAGTDGRAGNEEGAVVEGTIKSSTLVPNSNNVTWLVSYGAGEEIEFPMDTMQVTGSNGEYHFKRKVRSSKPGNFTVTVKTDDGAEDSAGLRMKYKLPKVEDVKIAESSYTIYLSWKRADFGPYAEGGQWQCDRGYEVEWAKDPQFTDARETMAILEDTANVVNEETGEEFCSYQIEGLEPKTVYYVRVSAYANLPWGGTEDGDDSDTKDIEVGPILNRWSYQAEKYLNNTDLYSFFEGKIFMDSDLPCKTLVENCIDNGMEWETNAWNSLKTAFDIAGNAGTAVQSGTFEHKDVYEAIIFKLMENQTLKCDHGAAAKWVSTMDKLYKKTRAWAKEFRRIDLMTESDFWELDVSERNAIMEHMQDGFLEYFHLEGLGTAFNILDKVNSVADKVKTFEEIFNYAANYLQIASWCVSKKEMAREMYYQAQAYDLNNDLVAALSDIVDLLDADEDEFIDELMGKIGMKTFREGAASLIGDFWGGLKKKVMASNPYLAFWWVTCQTEYYLMDSIFGVSDISSKYLEMKAIIEVEVALRAAYESKKTSYMVDKTEERAEQYIEAGDLLINLYVLDSNYAANFVDACDSGILRKAEKAFGHPGDSDGMKSSLEAIARGYMANRLFFMTNWIGYLPIDYPDEYSNYKHLLEDEAMDESLIEHSWGEWKVGIAATCGAAGSEICFCEICGKPMTRSISPTGKHSYGEWTTVLPPTAYAGGIRTRKCSVCGHIDTGFLGKLPAGNTGSSSSDGSVGNIGPGYRTQDPNGSFEILGSDNAAYIGPPLKNAKSAAVPDAVTVNGVAYHVTAVADNAFKGNTKLTSVTIGANVTSIGSQAFAGCTNLKSVTIPKSVETIGKKAFYNCKKLRTVRIKTSKLRSIGANAFKKAGSSNYKKLTVTVPKAKRKKYKTMLKKAKLSAKAKVK